MPSTPSSSLMPFITEELWQALYERKQGDSIMIAPTESRPFDDALLTDFGKVKEIIAGIRTIVCRKYPEQRKLPASVH